MIWLRLLLLTACAGSVAFLEACREPDASETNSAMLNGSNSAGPAPAPATPDNAADPAAIREAPADVPPPVDDITAPTTIEENAIERDPAETPGEKATPPEMPPDPRPS